MRILTLDIEGFGPFKDRQVLDFAEAASGGLLLITGPTGAGKSSLLDAVSFALYGAVPRYDGQVSRVRSDHSAPDQPTVVRLDFDVAGETYRVERSPEYERPAKRGGGMTTQKTEARLWRLDAVSGEWEGLASRPVDVAALLSPVLRLNHQQFLQVVMLSQGGFQRFLKSNDDERQVTLRTLFQTDRYQDIENALVDRRKALDGAARESEARIEGLLTGLEDSLKRDADVPIEAASATLPERRDAAAASVTLLEGRAAELEAATRDAQTVRAGAAKLLEDARTLEGAQRRLFAAEARKIELDAERSEIEGVRERVALSDRAERVAVEAAKLDRADTALTVAEAVWAERIAALTPDDGADVDSATGLEANRDAAAKQLGQLADAREDEELHARLAAETAALRAEIERANLAATAERDAIAKLPGAVAALREERGPVLVGASSVEQRANERDAADERRAAAVQAETLADRVAEAQLASAERASAAAARTAVVSDLLARRIAGMAGELAANLADGDACQVCGSTSHPNLAEVTDQVTPEAIEAAEAAQRDAQAALERARAAERDLEAQLATARGESAGLTLEAATLALDKSNKALAAAKTHAARLTALDAELAALETELATRNERVVELTTQAATTTARLEANDAQLTSLAAALAAARGEFESIDARVAALNAEHQALAAALTAHAALESANANRVDAAADLEAALEAQRFDTREAASEARIAAGELAVLRDRVRLFDEATQRNAGELASPDLQNLERTPVELEPFVEADAAAQARANEALAQSAAAARISGEHRATLERVNRELEGSAATGAELLALRRLADTVQGKDPNTKRMRLEVFVLAARLEAIVAAANLRLQTMVGGRYRLAHDDGLRARGRQSGLGLAIVDEYTGRSRTTDSLSGGESFLASLALALGLADVVTAESGGLELDTLFIDEGFGTLDPDALDQALATLDGLREGGRTVALISHVAELKERLAGGLEVVADGHGVSSLRGDGVHAVADAESAPHNQSKEPR